MKSWPALLLSLTLAACASAPVEQGTDHLFHDPLFAPPSQPISAAAVFEVSDEMRHYLREAAPLLDAKGRPRGLYEALYNKSQLKLDYDGEMTRNASQAFAARSGNCMSLAIMTAAFAKELGLSVHYHRVYSEESWSQSGGLYFVSAHINVTLGRKQGDPRFLFAERNLLTIDFLPLEGRQHAANLREETVVAMYMNNRAAETLARGELDDAYWWARAAIAQDPRFLGALNTLGVIYRRHGNLKEAEEVLQHVLRREPANTHVMSNLALVYANQGRTAEASELTSKLAALQPYPPFYFFNKGMAAMREGDYRAARDLFAREVERDAYYHEFHFWLAAAHIGLGEVKRARQHLAIALENSATRTEHQLYAAKLGALSAAK